MFRIGFNTLYAANGAKLKPTEEANFLSVLREAIFWQIDGQKDDATIEEIMEGILNNLAPAE